MRHVREHDGVLVTSRASSSSAASAEEADARRPPPEWGHDALTQFLDDARGNQWATFHNKGPAAANLMALGWMSDRVLRSYVTPNLGTP